MQDPRKEAVYTWEDEWPGWGHNQITLTQCREIIWRACDSYKVIRPTVVEHPERSYSWSIPSLRHISLQGGEHLSRGGRNVATALHEAAHHIAWCKHGNRIQDHGRTFLKIYIDLLVRAKVAPRTALEATAREHGLKI